MSKKSVLKFITYVLVAAMFLVGLFIFIYPLLSGYVSERNSSIYIENFENKKSSYTEAKQSDNSGDTQSDSSQEEQKKKNTEALDELYKEMQRYNTNIYKNGQEGLCDAWAYEQTGIDLSEYGVYDGVVGVLRVPKMSNLEMPIFLGASRYNMSLGAAQLGQTSMPIGGNNTNCVLAGHRGWSGARFFLDIEQMEIGDMVYIENLWDTLSYRVSDIKIIYPNDIEEILIQENKDMLTLFTCHPYWASTYRYVVYCTRVESAEQAETTSTEEGETHFSDNQTVTVKEPGWETEESVITNDETSQSRIFIERFSYIAIPVMLIALFVILTLIRRKK